MFASILSKTLPRLLLALVPLAIAPQSGAAPLTLADIDKTNLAFNIATLDNTTNAPAGFATGQAHQVDFRVDFDSICRNCGATNDSKAYTGLPGRFDALHLGSDFTVTFDNPITSLLVALSNDNRTLDGPDFGRTPDEISGNLNLLGTKISITQTSGGLALFNFDTAITQFSHVNDCVGGGGPNATCDGWNVALFAFAAPAVAPVPVPAALPLTLTGLAILGIAGRRRRVI